MLNAIRQRAGSWIVKVLLLLLVASFAVWGIGDIFYGGARNPTVAEVGDSEILASELSTEFRRVVNTIQRQLGTGIDREQAIRLGLMQQALQDLVARRLIDLSARDLGLVVDDDTLRQLVVSNPAFQTGGRFDRSRFEQLLLANGLDEESYLAGLRQDVLRGMLTQSLTGPVEAPEVLVDALYRHRNEQRRGGMLLVDSEAVEEVPEPTEEQIATYHADHEATYTAPELREVSFVTVEPDDLLEEIEIAEDQLRATYEERIDAYRTPARREVQQLLASERSAIERAAEAIAAGTGFEAAANDEVTYADLGEMEPGQLPGALDEAVFALDVGSVSEPIESPFGWHLFVVNHEAPEQRTPFAEVRDEIEQEVALEEAGDRLPALANALDDELAAGLSLEEAAANVGLDSRSLAAVDRRGLGESSEPVEALPDDPSRFLEVTFETPAGETSLLEEADDGSYFVLRVDRVQEPRLKPVDEVREEVVAAWQAQERRRLAREKAETLRLRAGEVASFEAPADAPGVDFHPLEPIARGGTPDGPATPAAIEALFRTSPGEIAEEVVEVVGGFGVVRTEEIISADPTSDPQGVASLRDQLSAEMKADIVAQYEQALRDTYPVEINESEVNRVGSADGIAPAGGPAGFL